MMEYLGVQFDLGLAVRDSNIALTHEFAGELFELFIGLMTVITFPLPVPYPARHSGRGVMQVITRNAEHLDGCVLVHKGRGGYGA